MGFADTDTHALLAARQNLLRGLDRVAGHAVGGTLHTVPAGRSTPPAASGWLTVILLDQVNAELRARSGAAVVPAR